MKQLEFLLDTFHAAFFYPPGLTQPRVARGYFSPNENGAYQRIFFEELLSHGFMQPKQYKALMFSKKYGNKHDTNSRNSRNPSKERTTSFFL